jgi:hypothetical protein
MAIISESQNRGIPQIVAIKDLANIETLQVGHIDHEIV